MKMRQSVLSSAAHVRRIRVLKARCYSVQEEKANLQNRGQAATAASVIYGTNMIWQTFITVLKE